MDLPATPLHPAGDVEVASLPTLPLPVANIDLNPDLYDSDRSASASNSPAAAGEDGPSLSDRPSDPQPSVEPLRQTYTVPVDDAVRLLQHQLGANAATSEAQQSKLVNYIDDTLLQIHRRFIKNITNLDNNQPYLLAQLAQDLARVVDLVWHSVSTHTRLFGQQNYLSTIVTDLEEFVAHYRLTDIPGPARAPALGRVLGLLLSLDAKLSFLIDGYACADGTVQKLSATDVVRLVPVVMRLRVAVVTQLEELRADTLPEDRPALDVEAGRVFEGIIARAEQ